MTQPWATLVAIGAKTLETRSYPTPYRGPLAVQAARSFPSDARELVYQPPFVSALRSQGYTSSAQLPLGVIVGIVRLVEVYRMAPGGARPPEPVASFGDFSSGRWVWCLEDAQRLQQPIPVRGQPIVWELAADVVRAIQEQIECGNTCGHLEESAAVWIGVLVSVRTCAPQPVSAR